MAKLPAFKKITLEDYSDMPREMAQPFEKLVTQLNGFMASVYDALNRNLDFDNNLNGQWKTIQVKAPAAGDVTSSFTSTVRNPKGVTIENIYDITSGSKKKITSTYSLGSWSIEVEAGAKQIVFNSIRGLTAGNKYEITFLVKG